jgi:spore coat protein H
LLPFSLVSKKGKTMLRNTLNAFAAANESTGKLLLSSVLTVALGNALVSGEAYAQTSNTSVSAIEIVQDGSQGFVGSTLRQLIFRAVAQSGVPVKGAVVNFTVTSGGGTLSRASATSDAGGFVTVVPTLSMVPGAMHIQAKASGSTAVANVNVAGVTPDATSAKRAELYNPDWTLVSHRAIAPNYNQVFAQDRVNQLDIRMTAAQWASVSTDMRAIYGINFGQGFPRPDPANGPGGPGGGPPGGGMFGTGENPSYVPVQVRYNGKLWRQVGFRLKGNFSLASAWADGSNKLPFRLSFNQFEDQYDPAIRDQNLYGFNDLTFAPNAQDATLLREKLAADLLRAADIPTARTSFVRVSIDIGQGPQYRGIYTQNEAVDDTLIKNFFGSDVGNIYKPESTFESFQRTAFSKKNNQGARADFSDVQSLINALNSAQRRTDPAAWRANLERSLDVNSFLRWLAANTAMVNRDAYGAPAGVIAPAHNYYLYHDPIRKLVWIPWDLSEAFIGNPGIDPPPPRNPNVPPDPTMPPEGGLSLSLREVGSDWPLLRFLIDDPIYGERYSAELKRFVAVALAQPQIDATIDRLHSLITPFVLGPNGELANANPMAIAAFRMGPEQLKQHFNARRILVQRYIPN